MKTLASSWLLSGLALLATACAGDDLGPVFNEISEKESDLQFYGPGLAGGSRQIIAGYNKHNVWRVSTSYRSIHGHYPQAHMIFYELPPGRHYYTIKPVEKEVLDWNWFKGKTVELGTAGTTTSKLGNIRLVALTVDGKSCVAWKQPMGTKKNNSVGNMLLLGYYCGEGDTMITETEAASIVKQIGHRKYGPLEPPEDWMPPLPELTAEIVNFGPYVVDEKKDGESGRPSGEAKHEDRKAIFGPPATRVPDELDTVFGFEYVLKGLAEDQMVSVTIRIFHPEFNGRTFYEENSGKTIGKPSTIGYRFDHEHERVPGTWIFQILYNERILAEKSFQVVRAE